MLHVTWAKHFKFRQKKGVKKVTEQWLNELCNSVIFPYIYVNIQLIVGQRLIHRLKQCVRKAFF